MFKMEIFTNYLVYNIYTYYLFAISNELSPLICQPKTQVWAFKSIEKIDFCSANIWSDHQERAVISDGKKSFCRILFARSPELCRV